MTLRIVVVTHSPSPYQLELFDAVAALPGLDLAVHYLYAADPARQWATQQPQHQHWIGEKSFPQGLERQIAERDLLVLNYYQHPLAVTVLNQWHSTGKPWVFWGERPGFRFPRLGRLTRRWWLRALHRSQAPIWGIGSFALEAYRSEFGPGHAYVNLPYFSNLSRFQTAAPSTAPSPERTILFSGSLIPRKGVLELAQAFAAVAPRFPHLRLRLLGSGPLEPQLRAQLHAVSGQVSFLGFRDWADLPAEYALADLLCVPSRHDGWGLVVPEGLAAGLPVIATTRMGAALDLIQPGENGWLVAPGDVQALIATLEQVAQLDAAALASHAARARASVAQHSLSHGASRFTAACLAASSQ